MKRTLALALWLACATPAVAGVVPHDPPTVVSPDHMVQVEFLVGPHGKEGQYISVNRLTVELGGLVREHDHETSDEIVVMLQGEGLFTLDGKTTLVKAGDTVFVPRGRRHAFIAQCNGPVKLLQIYEPAGPEDRFRKWRTIPSPIQR